MLHFLVDISFVIYIFLLATCSLEFWSGASFDHIYYKTCFKYVLGVCLVGI